MSEAARSNRQYTEDPRGSNDSLSYVTQPFLPVIALNGLMKTLISILPSGADGACDLWAPVQRQRAWKRAVTFFMSRGQRGETGGIYSAVKPRVAKETAGEAGCSNASRRRRRQKRDGSRDDCQRLKAITLIWLLLHLLFFSPFDDNIIDAEQIGDYLLKVVDLWICQ